MSGEKFDVLGLNRDNLLALFEKQQVDFPKVRAEQVYDWMYNKRVVCFDHANNLPKALKDILTLGYPKVIKELTSIDGTRKLLIELFDKEKIETVVIPSDERSTVCLSSQVGCKMGCKFCNTATQGFTRDLSCGEILSQVLLVEPLPTNLVFMGMGEPLNNFDNVIKAIAILTDTKGMGFSKNKITISTSGVITGIARLSDCMSVPLAISLHAADDQKRSKIMPINHTHPIHELLAAVKLYSQKTRARKITIEYMLIQDFNDSKDDAKNLIALLKGTNFKVNLIPFNDWGHKFFRPSPKDKLLLFQSILKKSHIQCNIRKSMGHDIMAACGELKAKEGR